MSENILQKIEQAKNERSSDSRSWDLCLAYLEGRQYLYWDKIQTQYVNLPQQVQTGRNRITINKLLNIYRNVVSRLSASYPSIVVTGTTGSYEEITKSEASELAIRWYWTDQKMNIKWGEVAKWACATGNAALHTVWDETGEKITTNVISPYNLFWEPGASSPEEARWVAIKALEPREELIRLYPDYAEQIENIPAETMRDQIRPGGVITQGGSTVPENNLAFYEVVYRDGHVEFWIGGGASGIKVLERETPGKCFPVQFVRFTDLPGRLWGLGLIVQLVDLQNMYNRSRNLVFDSGELMTNPVWLVPKSAAVPADAITNQPGKVIHYNSQGGKPERAAGVDLPSFFQNSINELNAEIMDVAGVQAVSLGKRPVGITAAKAIEALTQNDISQLQTTQDNFEQAAQDLAYVVLQYMQAYYTEKKFIKILDVSGRTVKKELDHTDLMDTPMVHIEAGSLFRDEVEDRDAKTMNLLQAGIIDKDEARARMALHVGNRDAVKRMQAYSHAEDLLDAAKGGKDEFDPRTGTMIPKGIEIWPTDDLEAIKEVFIEFARSRDYTALPAGRQTYVRDILAAVQLFMQGQTDPNAFDQAVNQMVWPLQPNDPAQALQEIEGSSSPEAAQQIAGQAQMMAQRGAQLQQGKNLLGAQAPLPPAQGIPEAPPQAGLVPPEGVPQ